MGELLFEQPSNLAKRHFAAKLHFSTRLHSPSKLIVSFTQLAASQLNGGIP